MATKIPGDAFDFYLSLGSSRSFDVVAKRYGVTKRGVGKRAARERWTERAAEIERKAREATDRKAVESIESVNARHMKIAQAVQGKGLEALRTLHITDGMDAIRAVEAGVKLERLVRGEPEEGAPGRIGREEIERIVSLIVTTIKKHVQNEDIVRRVADEFSRLGSLEGGSPPSAN